MRAFSLVELSIVLVILGLLTGGILAGQSLIRAAELRSVSADFQRYQAAINTFRDKYMALPGDLPNATRFWPSAINGNGDGLFGNFNGQGVVAWQHLSLSGLIEGSYSGIQATTPGNGTCAATTECPASRISNRVFLTVTNSLVISPPYSMDRRTQGIFFFRGLNIDYDFGLTAEEVWNMDTKLDDGRPGSGILVGMGSGGFLNGLGWPNCSLAADGAAYDVMRTTADCKPYWLLK